MYFFALLLMSEATTLTHFALRRQPYPKNSDCFSMSIREKLYVNDTLIMKYYLTFCLHYICSEYLYLNKYHLPFINIPFKPGTQSSKSKLPFIA